MRDDIDKFSSLDAQVVTVAPESVGGRGDYPFPLLADTEHKVFDAYDVVSTMMSLGQRPAVFVIDRDGVVRFDSIGTQQWQIPTNENVLTVIGGL